MSAALALGASISEQPEMIERIGHHQYRVKVASKHEKLNSTFIGSGYDWRYALTEQPFQHLPFESYLALSVYRWVAFQQSQVVNPGTVEMYIPGKIATDLWRIRTKDEQNYTGFLFDWRHQPTDTLVMDVNLQASLSYGLLCWLCRFKEWEYESRAALDFEKFFGPKPEQPHGDRRDRPTGRRKRKRRR